LASFSPRLNEILTELGVKPTIDLLKDIRRGIENEPRDVTMDLIRSMRSEPLMRVGAGLGLNRYRSVSSAICT
jgi:hypothetical protein